MNERKIAIYTRKSKFTAKGESIGNQVEICKNYLSIHYPEISEDDIIVFEDEGFSGGNTKRPQFQKMMKACRNKEIDMIVCYRLDRISRSTADFVSMYDEFTRLDIKFVSVNERFDTSAPIGKAMMMITSIFAQLERDTIAERIRDNMYELAKTGRWLGGNTPTGYESEETVGSYTVDGKARKAYKLKIIPEEIEVVKLIFDKYLELRSFTAVDAYLLQNDIQTKLGNSFSRFTLKAILQNPVYAMADEDTYSYFKQHESQIFSEEYEWNGKKGLMVYHKTKQKTGHATEFLDMKEWVVAVGKHKGVIKGSDWVKVQKLIDNNSTRFERVQKSKVALLSGLLRCADCGSFMRPKMAARYNSEGERIYDYLCELKEHSKSQKCNMKRIRGNDLDRQVCEEIKMLVEDKSEFIKILKREQKKLTSAESTYEERLTELRASLKTSEAGINNCVKSITMTDDDTARQYLLKQLSDLHKNKDSIEAQIKDYEHLVNNAHMSDEEFDNLANTMSYFANMLDKMSVEQKRAVLRQFINKITWDGENVEIYLFGSESDALDLSDFKLLREDSE